MVQKRTVELEPGKTACLALSGYSCVLYRSLHGRDLFVDMASAYEGNNKKDNGEIGQFSGAMVDVLLRLLHTMSRAGDKYAADQHTPEDYGEFLDSFDTPLSVYQILPVVFEMYAKDQLTTIEAKKNLAKVAAR